MGDGLLLAGKLVAFLVTAWAFWRMALSVGPNWLRKGEGPLWLLASLVPFSVAVVSALLGRQNPVVDFLRFRPGSTEFYWLLAGSLLLLISFVGLRLLLGVSRVHSKFWRIWFLVAGVLPDDTPVRSLQAANKATAVILLAIAAIAGVVMRASDVGGVYPILWGVCVAGLVGGYLAYVHPTEEWRPPVVDGDLAGARGGARQPLSSKVAPLLQWLGAHSPRDLPAAASDALDSGLAVLYPFQERLVGDVDLNEPVLLVGPVGSGRSTAAILTAIHRLAGRGESGLIVVESSARAHSLSVIIDRLRATRVEVGSLSVGTLTYVSDADIWIATPGAILDLLDRLGTGGMHDGNASLVHRLGSICIDDIEDFSGPPLVELRYLLFRIGAVLGPWRDLKTILVSGLSEAAARSAARHIMASPEFSVVALQTQTDGLGPSRSIRRMMFRLDGVSWSEQDVVPGLPGVVRGAQRLASQASEGEPVYGLLVDGFPDPGVECGSACVAQPDVVMLRVDGNNAAEALKRGRRYPSTTTELIYELVMLAEDPVSRWLEGNLLRGQRAWPDELRHELYPRVLAQLPGVGLHAEGAKAGALRHIAQALQHGPQSLARLNSVFSPDVVAEFKTTTGQVVTMASMWTCDAKREPPFTHSVEPAIQARRGGVLRLPNVGKMVDLHDPVGGQTFRMPRSVVNYEAPAGSIIKLGDAWFEVRGDGHDARRLTDVQGAQRTAPIRDLSFKLKKPRSLPKEARFAGERWVRSQRWQVQVGLTHQGVHVFGLEGSGNDRSWRRLETVKRSPETYIHDDELLTEAWVVWFDEAPREMMHTLVHILRDSIDYFFLRASNFIGVAWQHDLQGRPALVFYERSSGGDGSLETISTHAEQDLKTMLRCAQRLLASCPGRGKDLAKKHACGICCYSISCTNERHNQELDAVATVSWLNGLLGPVKR